MPLEISPQRLAVSSAQLPFAEQIAFFRQKLNLGTRRWTDIQKNAHDHRFVVAGAMKADLLTDLRAAVDGAIADGKSIQWFRQQFDAAVDKAGWAYRGERNWRTRVIYQTNMATSYAAGRLAQLRASSLPLWMYKHSDSVVHPRPLHLSWDGITLPRDHPWFKTHFAPNGWGCKCRIVGVTRTTAQALGGRVLEEPPDDGTYTWHGETIPRGIDPGWNYMPGESWVRALTPVPLDVLPASASAAVAAVGEAIPWPAARAADPARVLREGLPERDYVDAFLGEFGIEQGASGPVAFQDVTGEVLLVGEDLFRARDGSIKVAKRGRERYVRLLADTIRSPDLIVMDWAEVAGAQSLRRRYLARWTLPGQDVPALAVFDTGEQGWVGVTAFAADDVAYLERQAARGKIVYRRGEKK